MAPPCGTAKLPEEIIPGVARFKMHNEQIDGESDCYVVTARGGAVFIDPCP
jgi:hypothetical protein